MIGYIVSKFIFYGSLSRKMAFNFFDLQPPKCSIWTWKVIVKKLSCFNLLENFKCLETSSSSHHRLKIFFWAEIF